MHKCAINGTHMLVEAGSCLNGHEDHSTGEKSCLILEFPRAIEIMNHRKESTALTLLDQHNPLTTF